VRFRRERVGNVGVPAAMPALSPHRLEIPRCITRALAAALLAVLGAAPATAATAAPVLVGAGDITQCSSGAEATAKLLDGIAGTVFTAGDNAYPHGSLADYERCYAPTWGRQLTRTRPAPGNHEYETAGAAGYFAYFGARAGSPSRGYYSYDLGSWHVVVLNSSDNCQAVACSASSTQVAWLKADLAASTAACTVAIWHHPRFSSGPHGSQTRYVPFWDALYAAGADVVVNGHDHIYQRFAPQTPAGAPDDVFGIREFVVGTGGKSHDKPSTPLANTEKENGDAFGVLALTLHPASYAWRFVPVPGATFTDAGTAPCHGAPGPPTIAITQRPAAVVDPSRAIVAWRTTGATRTTCTVDGRRLAACRSPLRLRGLATGRHALVLHATGPRGSHTATVAFRVLPLPVVTITSHPRRATLARRVALGFTVRGSVTRIRCRLDAGRPRRCGSPWRLSGLRNGPHVVRVTAANAAGPRTAVFGFVVGGAPWIRLLTRPPAVSTPSVLFRWGVVGARGPAMCRLDARRPRRCVSRAAYARLAPGVHRFELRVPGRRGKVGVIVVRWRVR
jgi:hypothetical protein